MRYMISFSPDYPETAKLDANIESLQAHLEEEEDDAQKGMLRKKLLPLQQQRDAIVCDGDIITYWETNRPSPWTTNEHPLHELIAQVWRENVVSKLVLSCATLPHDHGNWGRALFVYVQVSSCLRGDDLQFRLS